MRGGSPARAVIEVLHLPRFRALVPTLVVLGSAMAVIGGSPAGASKAPSLTAYQGLGSWVDIYDAQLWRDPAAVISDMHSHGVRTLFLETGNWRIDTKIFEPAVVAKYVDEAHSQGMKAVAWYVPDFKSVDRDLARSLAAARFTTSSGERFDSFGLDIESTEVRDPKVRTAQALLLSTRIRQAVGPSYPLAAIVPSPYAMRLIPTYWPGFPFEKFAALYDVFVPMGYFTFRTNGPTEAAAYTTATLSLLDDFTGGAPVHAIGGLASNTSGSEVAAFVGAAMRQGVIGASLYDFSTMGSEDWSALQTIDELTPKPPTPPKTTRPVVTSTPSHPVVRDAPPLVPFCLCRSHLLAR